MRLRGKGLSGSWLLLGATLLTSFSAMPIRSFAQASGDSREWRTSGGNNFWNRYSPLDGITASNVSRLQMVWNRDAVDATLKAEFPDLSPSNYFRGTPIVVDGVLYAPDGVGLVEAFDGETGRTRWIQQPFKTTLKEASGQSTRGVAYWRSGDDERIVAIRGEYLYALNAKTGASVAGFGEAGRVLLDRATPDHAKYFGYPGPLVANDVIVVSGNGGGRAGNGYGDGGITKEQKPDDIRGYDVHDGKLLWTFHVMPTKTDASYKSWGKGSAEYVGHMGAWGPMTADERLGYIYVSLAAPTDSTFGGHRPGKNLYSDSIVALDSRTGKLVWFYQLVHHDLWDYDPASAPILGNITVNGRKIRAVFASGKTAFLYVLDRVTGKPVWPIIERPVPSSTVPGEEAWPTQPFPTKPPAYDRQGFGVEDVIDFTPELHRRGLEIVNRYRLGPMFTPPSLNESAQGGKKGSMVLPAMEGGGSWNTGAFDPITGIYYATSVTKPWIYALEKPVDPAATLDYVPDVANTVSHETRKSLLPGEIDLTNFADPDAWGIEGLPLVKPPYARITALDLNHGTKLWMAANGDGPRAHPLLKDLNLPPLGNAGRSVAFVTKSLLFVTDASDAIYGEGVAGPAQLRAYDKATGSLIASIALPVGATGGAMTYRMRGVQYIVIPVGGTSYGAGWIALAIR